MSQVILNTEDSWTPYNCRENIFGLTCCRMRHKEMMSHPTGVHPWLDNSWPTSEQVLAEPRKVTQPSPAKINKIVQPTQQLSPSIEDIPCEMGARAEWEGYYNILCWQLLNYYWSMLTSQKERQSCIMCLLMRTSREDTISLRKLFSQTIEPALTKHPDLIPALQNYRRQKTY